MWKSWWRRGLEQERRERRGHEGVKATQEGKQPALWSSLSLHQQTLARFSAQVCQWTAFQRHLGSSIVDLSPPSSRKHFRSIRSSPKRGTTPVARYLFVTLHLDDREPATLEPRDFHRTSLASLSFFRLFIFIFIFLFFLVRFVLRLSSVSVEVSTFSWLRVFLF